MAAKYSRQALTTPVGLMSSLQDLFPHFEDLEEVRSGEANLHTVMSEFCSSFDAAGADDRQLAALAQLMHECVSEIDNLENAVGTCFLEHLRQIDRSNIFRKFLSPEVKGYMRRYC